MSRRSANMVGNDTELTCLANCKHMCRQCKGLWNIYKGITDLRLRGKGEKVAKVLQMAGDFLIDQGFVDMACRI